MHHDQNSLAAVRGVDPDENEWQHVPLHDNARVMARTKPDNESLRRNHRPEVNKNHPAYLTGNDVVRAYEAISFVMWKHGVVLNCHITLNWGQMGVQDGPTAVRLLGKYNSEAAKWLRVGMPGHPVQRAPKRQGFGADYFFVDVHENGGSEGFHTHKFCHVPAAMSADFFEWSRRCFARLLKRETIPKSAFWPVIRHSKDEGTSVARSWAWFRYLAKQLDERVQILDDNGGWKSARELFKPWPYRAMMPLPVPHAVRVSENIGRSARATSGFVSRYITGEWDQLYQGNELNDRRMRLRNEQHEAEWQALAKTLNIGIDYPQG